MIRTKKYKKKRFEQKICNFFLSIFYKKKTKESIYLDFNFVFIRFYKGIETKELRQKN